MYNKAATMPPEHLEGNIVIGEFANVELPEYVEQYLNLIERVGGNS